MGGGPRVVVSTAAFHARVRGSVPGPGGLKDTKMFLPHTRVKLSTAAFHARVRGSVPGLGGLKETKNVSSPSTCESQYCGEPPWPRGSELARARISSPVSGRPCRLIHLTILRRFSWPNLAYMYTKVSWSPVHFMFIFVSFDTKYL